METRPALGTVVPDGLSFISTTRLTALGSTTAWTRHRVPNQLLPVTSDYTPVFFSRRTVPVARRSVRSAFLSFRFKAARPPNY